MRRVLQPRQATSGSWRAVIPFEERCPPRQKSSVERLKQQWNLRQVKLQWNPDTLPWEPRQKSAIEALRNNVAHVQESISKGGSINLIFWFVTWRGPKPYLSPLSPCTLHSTPYTLQPTPYTLHPKHYTLYPTPHTPAPHNQNPATQTSTPGAGEGES